MARTDPIYDWHDGGPVKRVSDIDVGDIVEFSVDLLVKADPSKLRIAGSVIRAQNGHGEDVYEIIGHTYPYGTHNVVARYVRWDDGA